MEHNTLDKVLYLVWNKASDMTLDEAVHLNHLSFEPGSFHSGAHSLPSMFGVRSKLTIANRISA